MGTILGSRVLSGGRVKLRIAVDEAEALSLQGRSRKIGVFASGLCKTESGIMARGKGGVAKHFYVPFNLRVGKDKPIYGLKCHKVETQNKVMYVYVVDHEKKLL